MKKLVAALCIVVIVLSIGLVLLIMKIKLVNKNVNSSFKSSIHFFPTNDVTLNGLSADAANILVQNFVDDNTSMDNKTAIWFSKKWVDEMDSLLSAEQKDINIKVDGFRLYFAKKASGRNTVIVVSTNNGRNDYFIHRCGFLDDLRNHPEKINFHIIENYKGIDAGGDPGATLYNNPFNCLGVEDCVLTAGNDIPCDDANKSVLNFLNEKPNQGINSVSEWFPLSLLQGLDTELNAAPKEVHADGIRIYFAKNKKNTNRHHFILVTTQASNDVIGHKDNYHCYDHNVNFLNDGKGNNDNGELCPTHCQGAMLPIIK